MHNGADLSSSNNIMGAAAWRPENKFNQSDFKITVYEYYITSRNFGDANNLNEIAIVITPYGRITL